MVETRKIVKSGNSSYVLSLPIKWVRKNDLEKDKSVIVNENDVGDLIISVKTKSSETKSALTVIKIDGKDEDTVNLELLTAYIRDASSIIFEGKEVPVKASKIIESVKSFIALDIIEQSTDSITVKNFFHLDLETSPRILIRKMDIVNRASMTLLSNFFKKGFANEDFFELQKLNEQNDHLFTLVRKCVLKLFENPRLMPRLQTNPLQTTKDRLFSQSLTHISTNFLVVGKAFLFLDPKREDNKMLSRDFNKLIKDYNTLISAINNSDYELIHEFIKESIIRRVELDRTLKTLDDPLAAQVIASLLSVYYNLRELGYESLA
jgi:phosphate uptake regulator